MSASTLEEQGPKQIKYEPANIELTLISHDFDLQIVSYLFNLKTKVCTLLCTNI